MYFIKCDHCGFENPLKTEYLTFCESCGKKLQLNFQDWIKQHPQGNFEVFKKEAGGFKQVASVSPQIKPVTRIRLLPVALSLLLLFTALIFLFSSKDSFTDIFLPDSLPGRVLDQNWQRYTYGNSGLSLLTPEKIVGDKMKIPASARNRIQDIQSYSWHPAKGFRLLVKSTQYQEMVPVNLNLVATAAINELLSRPGIANVEFRHSPIMYNDVAGVMLEGTCHENEKFMRFQCVLYLREANTWSVMVIYPDSDQTGKEVATRIMESVEINYADKSI